jgi:hypothetical protein
MPDVLMLVFRVLHIAIGAFWVGGVLMLAGFIEPAVRSLGPDGGKFMQHLMRQRRLGMWLIGAGDVTVLTGLAFLGHGIVSEVWRASAYGQALMFGSACGLVAIAIGHAVNLPASKKLVALGGAVQESGGPPTPDQAAEMARLQGRLRMGIRVGAVLLTATVVAMAAARQL